METTDQSTDDWLVGKGSSGTVRFAVRDDGTSPAKVFFSTLPNQTQQRFRALFGHVAESGPRNLPPVMFKHERGEIHTFKAKLEKRHIRMPCFRLDSCWFVTHGFFKPGGESEWPEQEFTLANAIRAEVVQQEDKKKKKDKGKKND